MSEKEKLAEDLFLQEYNCSQAVLAPFSEEAGLDCETALRLSSSFGAGMGRLREVCGAFSAMLMIAGLRFGYSDPPDNNVKTEHYRMIQELAERFKAQNGSLICRELLGLENSEDSPVPEERTENYYQNRPCLHIVKSTVAFIEKLIEEKQL